MIKEMKKIGLVRAACFALVAAVSAGAHCASTEQCFKDIGPRPTLRMTLGDPVRDDKFPSCGGIDGITSGAVLTFHLVKRGDGMCEEGASLSCRVDRRCPGRHARPDHRVSVPNRVSLPLRDWRRRLLIVPVERVPGELGTGARHRRRGAFPPPTSPLDGSTPWFVTRDMTIAQAQFCADASQSSGSLYCKDTFAVTSVTQEAP